MEENKKHIRSQSTISSIGVESGFERQVIDGLALCGESAAEADVHEFDGAPDDECCNCDVLVRCLYHDRALV